MEDQLKGQISSHVRYLQNRFYILHLLKLLMFFFSGQLLSVLCGHLFFHPSTTTSDFEEFLSHFYNYVFVLSEFLRKSQYFPF